MKGIRGVLSGGRIANIFGAAGYTMLAFALSLVAISVLYWAIRSGLLVGMGLTPESLVVEKTPTSPAPEAQSLSFVEQTMSVLVSIIVMFSFGFMMVSLPFWIGKISSALLKKSILLVVGRVSLGTLFFAKVVACSVVMAAALVLRLIELNRLPFLILQSLSIVAAIGCFSVQHYLAKASEVIEVKEVW